MRPLAKWETEMSTDDLSDFQDCDECDEAPNYRGPDEIEVNELRTALTELQLLGNDPFLRSQALNLAIVDHFITKLEYDLNEKRYKEEANVTTETLFLLAQSQMWIFAVYELLRTWRQRGREILKWSEDNSLDSKLQELETDLGYLHFGREVRAKQIRQILADPSFLNRIRDDQKRSHFLFRQVEAIRISLAKHEVKGRRNSVASFPGYGRVNRYNGSLQFEHENGRDIMGYISRRDIAEGIRALPNISPPTDEEIANFDAFMRGPGDIQF